jgi:cell division septation protein DedD
VSPERHFEMIVSGRQLVGMIALVAALLLVAFGLGVGVGLLQPGHAASAEAYHPPFLAGDRLTPRDSAALPVVTPLPEPTGAPRAADVAPPIVPADIAAATPVAVATAVPSPGPVSPTPAARATPAARPTAALRATATPRPKPTATPSPRSWVQVASLARSDQAEGVRQRVIALGFRGEQVLVLPGTGGKYRVRLGPFPDQESAGRVVARLQASGFPDAFTLRE